MLTLPTHGPSWLDGKKPKIAYMDLETFSDIELKTHGARRYLERAEVMLWLYADGNGEVKCWDLTAEPDGDVEALWILAKVWGSAGLPLAERSVEMPADLWRMLNDPDYLTVWHNGLSFDVPLLERSMGIRIPTERVWDTMHQAYAHSLPGSLDKLGSVLNLPDEFKKKAYGKNLILQFCKPRSFSHGLARDGFESKKEFDVAVDGLRQNWTGRASRLTHPEDWAAFIDYGLHDVKAMRECFKRMPRHNLGAEERRLWRLDSAINNRGILIDLDLCRAAIRATDREQSSLRGRVQEVTDGEVGSATQRDALLAFFLSRYDLSLDDLTKATVSRLLDQDDLPDVVRELLDIRQKASKSSTAKFRKFLDCTSNDGRLRGVLSFCGALRTGRWAGKLVQPHNLAQPKFGGRPMGEKAIEAGLLDDMADALKADCLDLIAPDVMEACSALVRGAIVAGPGKKLVIADLSAIEARVLPWLAGERKVLEAFRAYDRGEGADLYKVTFSNMFGVPVENVTKPQRQTGKVVSLATQFLGGVGAIVAMALLTKTNVETQIADLAYPVLPTHIKEEAEGMWEWALRREEKRDEKRKKILELLRDVEGHPAKQDESRKLQKRLARLGDATFGLSEKAFVACDGLKRLWREGNPKTVLFWGELENAVRNALARPGYEYEVGDPLSPDPGRPRLSVKKEGPWTWVQLPSGRRLYYPHMKVRDEVDEDADDEGNSNTLVYLGVNPANKQWAWIRTHKGVLSENVTQAVARDVLGHGMLRADRGW